MSNKIDINTKIQSSFEGPSKSYYQTKTRFDEILKNKLGIGKGASSEYSVSGYSDLSGITPTSNTNNYGIASSVNSIYDNVRLSSGASAAAIDEKLRGTELEGLGASFAKAEADYGVNAWFLTGLAIHESGYGTSKIAQDKNNLFGYQAYDATPYASAATFSSKSESIDYVAKYLSEAYLTPGGTYYNGTSVDSIGQRYATDPNWSSKVKKLMANLLSA
ncbi:glucosaminidase domain-containing protein [Fusibacter bizertensis]|jgi:Beta- N-acetylglucosaminidase|uniref:Glucosaminidase domain-containing protein n=1 Tax=Fusibacter bizertensis TaxID=1488331 RepID=A0ABT6NCN6_9FIRM|nr:glucosaminidase domain-containing protein [Fusibacter bizertensis]MDH8678171.1 glucosaminidase domain-containing protein [Fusibacter bizertensis]